MNTLVFPKFAFPTFGEGVGVLGLPVEQSAKRQLSGSADEIVRTISSVLDEMVLGVIEKRTANEFATAAAEVWPNYVKLVLSYASIVSTLVSRDVIAKVSAESFCELEADIREHAEQAFGTTMRDRAAFTVWTLRKISALLHLLGDRVVDGDREKESDYLTNFLLNALRARFNVDCLTTSMRTRHAIYPDVFAEIDEGLRSAVDAYAWIKQAVDLRFPEEDLALPNYWTPEDQVLVNESMSDLQRDESALVDEESW